MFNEKGSQTEQAEIGGKLDDGVEIRANLTLIEDPIGYSARLESGSPDS